MTALLDTWCEEVGGGTSWSFLNNALHEHHVTSSDRSVNPWWGVFEDALKDKGYGTNYMVFPAATDSRFLRAIGIYSAICTYLVLI